MPDLITGVLLLQRVDNETNLYRCWLQYSPAGKEPGQTYIMMKERTLPGPTGPHVWEFDRAEPWLHCRPSLRILGGKDQPDIFHNAGEWSNHYVQMAGTLGEDEHGSIAMRVHEEINWPAGKSKEERDAVILPYRAKGVLL